MPNNKLVCVFWRDVTALGTEWMKADEAIKACKDKFKLIYKTVGWIIHQDKDMIVVVATHDPTDDCYNDISMIPRAVVVDIKELKTK